MIHVAHFIMRGHRRVAIRTVDTDVVALSVTVAAKFISLSMRINRSKALPMFHRLTGCDSVSSFAGRGKKLSWGVWNVFHSLTDDLLILTPLFITF